MAQFGGGGDFSVFHSADPMLDLAQLQQTEEETEEFLFGIDNKKFASSFLMPVTTTATAILKHQSINIEIDSNEDKMLSAEYFGSIFDVVNAAQTESTTDLHKTGGVFEIGIKANGATIVMNASLNATESSFVPELFYRHSMAMTVVYCIAYLLVFAVGIVGNFFVIAVVFRSPRMRTVTNFFIVNLAVADILVIVFCLPATLMSNIFVRKYLYLIYMCALDRF